MKNFVFPALFLSFVATPALADMTLDLGGYFRGYGVYADNDEPAGTSLRNFEFRQDTELHFKAKTTLDNGLTVGFHNEMKTITSALENESYIYFSGGWGKVNAGSEDGAAYLLQVAAPSADSNIDGMRQYISGIGRFAPTGAPLNGLGGQTGVGPAGGNLEYDHADFGATDRLTYLSPKLNGFQAGVSWAPNAGQQNSIVMLTPDNDAGQYENLWDIAARWDGDVSGVKLSIGAGYSSADLESPAAPAAGAVAAGLDSWNVGASAALGEFSVGAAYLAGDTENFTGVGTATTDLEKDTWVVGAAWDRGPWHLGASYLEQVYERGGPAATDDRLEVTRLTLGAGYEYGPGMSLRAAIATGGFDSDLPGDNDFTQVTLGTDLQF